MLHICSSQVLQVPESLIRLQYTTEWGSDVTRVTEEQERLNCTFIFYLQHSGLSYCGYGFQSELKSHI